MNKSIKKTKRENKIRYRLIGKHVISSIDVDIEEIVFMKDCASWIKAYSSSFKYHKNMKITFSMNGFHFAQAIIQIYTKSHKDLNINFKNCCFNNKKEIFITICNHIISLHSSRTDAIIKKRDYIK